MPDSNGTSRNIVDTDQVIHDVIGNDSMWKAKDVNTDQHIESQEPAPSAGNEPQQLDTQANEGGNELAGGQHQTPNQNNIPAGQQQEPYFQTQNSTYMTEEEMKKGMLAKDSYVTELQQREKTYQDMIKNLTSGNTNQPVPQPAPHVPTKEEREVEFENLVEVHGQAGAIAMLANSIADEKFAARDRQTAEQHKQLQTYVDDFKRQNPGVPEATIQELKTKYYEVSQDENINPLAILYNPHTAQQPGNGGPVNMQTIQQDNQSYRQVVNNERKRLIPKTPQGRANPVNRANEISSELVKRVNAGDTDGALDLAFARAAELDSPT